MNKRYVAAGIMLISAFTLWFLSIIRADEVGYYQLSDVALISVGLLLCIAAFPVSGDLKDECDDKEGGANDKYYLTLEVTEQCLDGSYSSQPHTYKKSYSTAEEAVNGIADLLWECVEIECIESGKIFAEWYIEENTEGGVYFDHDESEIEIKVEHTDKPSEYFVDNGSPIPMSVDLAKSTFTIL